MRVLHEKEWPQVYGWMVRQNFPDVPPCYALAQAAFKGGELYGLEKNGRLMAAFILSEQTESSACLDVVAAPEAKGLWASRRTLRNLGELFFSHCCYRYLWCEPKRRAGLVAAVRCGFRPLAELRTKGKPPVFVLTPTALADRLTKYVRR